MRTLKKELPLTLANCIVVLKVNCVCLSSNKHEDKDLGLQCVVFHLCVIYIHILDITVSRNMSDQVGHEKTGITINIICIWLLNNTCY